MKFKFPYPYPSVEAAREILRGRPVNAPAREILGWSSSLEPARELLVRKKRGKGPRKPRKGRATEIWGRKHGKGPGSGSGSGSEVDMAELESRKGQGPGSEVDMGELEIRKGQGPGSEVDVAEVESRKRQVDMAELERKRLSKLRFWRFVRAMKRLGFLDHRKLKYSESLTDDVLEEILKEKEEEDDPEPGYWTFNSCSCHLNSFMSGSCSLDYLCPEFGDQMTKIIEGDLGKGDVLSEALTPDAIFQRLDPQLMSDIPFHAVSCYMIRAQEREILRRRLRAQAQFMAANPLADPTTEPVFIQELDEAPYMRDKRVRMENGIKAANYRFKIFLTALDRLGGEDNIANITPEDIYRVITQELDFPDWTVDALKATLDTLKIGGIPKWTADHHNRMLKALDELGRDPLNAKRVNPKDVLRLMDPDGTMESPMTLQGVKQHLERLRRTAKRDPNHPFCFPRKPDKMFYFSHSWTLQDILDIASEIEAATQK